MIHVCYVCHNYICSNFAIKRQVRTCHITGASGNGGNGKLKRKTGTESGNRKAEIWKWSSSAAYAHAHAQLLMPTREERRDGAGVCKRVYLF